MAKLKWNTFLPVLKIEDREMGTSLVLSKEEGIYYCVREKKYNINLSQIDHVSMTEPKLLKKGCIVFYENDSQSIHFNYDGLEVPAIVEFSKKYKSEFFLIFSILEENGLEVVVL